MPNLDLFYFICLVLKLLDILEVLLSCPVPQDGSGVFGPAGGAPVHLGGADAADKVRVAAHVDGRFSNIQANWTFKLSFLLSNVFSN